MDAIQTTNAVTRMLMRKPLLLVGRLSLLAFLIALACPAVAQQTQESQELQRVESPPPFGTFYSARTGIPYPFDPSFGKAPVYQWKPGVYIVDDSQGENANGMMTADGGGAMMMSMPSPCDPCATNSEPSEPISLPPAYSYDPTNLWLEITGITNNQAFFVIRTPEPLDVFDMFSTTNLTTNVVGLNRTNWIWLMRTDLGQTNVVLTNLWPGEGWFQLGTMQDTDLDGLPDAFENFVSKTNPQLRDSDSDGISDGDEMGPNGLPWNLEQMRRNSIVVFATSPTAVESGACGEFKVYLPKPAPAGGTVVQYHFAGKSVPGSEFTTTPSGNTLTIPAGQSFGTISVCAQNDSEYQDFERYVDITLTNATTFPFDSQSARINLVDNDSPGVRVFAFPQWVRKPSPTFGTNSAGFFFVRDGDSTSGATLNFSIGGTAVAGTDYDFLPSSINFAPNVRTNYLPITLKPTTNTVDKTLSVTAQSISGYQIDPVMGAATMTIASSTLTPLPVVQVTATDDDAREPSNPGTFTFTRTGPTTASLRVFYRVTGTASAAGVSNNISDYLELPGVVDFGVGQSSVTATVSPFDNDLEAEIMETVILVLSAGDYRVGTNNSATVYIDDNASPTYVAEVVRPGVHGLNASRPLYARVTRYGTAVSAASAGWTLTYGFTPNIMTGVTAGGNVSGNNVVWAARQSVANVTFSTTWSTQNDNVYNVTLNLNGSPFQGYRMYLPQSQLVRVTSTGSPATIITEGQNLNTLTFTRPHPSGATLSAGYSIVGSAVSGADFTGLSGAVNFPANGGGPITVAVQALANPQTNGWKTAVVTLDANNSSVGDVGTGVERAFFRIQDAQVSNPVFDTDIDNDGLADGWELANLSDGFDPTEPNNAYADIDRDGLQLFEEIQLGTNPEVADAQPTYPSEDPDDYVTLKLALGAKGKLPDLLPASCATCHSAGLTAGLHTRSTPRTSRDFQNNLQEHLIRFLRGSNYPVRLTDNPLAKVLPSSQTNSTPHLYTAAYTAQFLTASNAAYTLVADTNQLFGTNRPMVLETLARQATLFVPDLLIAADVNRDGIVNTSNRIDRTEPNTPFMFWINEDADTGSNDAAGDEEPGITAADSANATIDNLRDLEDFARLHFRVEGLPGNLLTNVNLQTRIRLTNIVGTPSLRLFRATEANGGLGYLTNTTTANSQIAKAAAGVLTHGAPLVLAGTNWSSAGTNRFFLPFIFEGISTGRCTIVFTIGTNGGPDVAFSRQFNLELRSVSRMYEHWTVGDNINTPVSIIPDNATRVPDSAVFAPPQRDEELDYLLFVHGWRMRPWERRAFANTAYKRLWQLGYRGRFGLFSWPTDWTIIDPTNFEGLLLTLLERQNYDRSEERAWRAGDALERLLTQLNQQHPNRVRLLGHSMGNIVISEALYLHGRSNNVPFVHTYIASQAASVAHGYDAIAPEVVRPGWIPGMTTPEVYAEFPRRANATERYFTNMNRAVTADPQTLTRRIFNFHNAVDFALDKAYSWPYNQLSKPDTGYTYRFGRWLRTDGKNTRLILPRDYREVYSWIAEARSKALGCSEDATHAVRGEIGSAFNLQTAFNYQNGSHEHSAQFNSINMNRRSYWWQVLSSASLTNGLPTP